MTHRDKCLVAATQWRVAEQKIRGEPANPAQLHVPQSDSIRRSHTADARLLDRNIYEKYGISKLVSEGNFITKNIAVPYQLYVIGGSQADD
jgi:hypothetical protein